MDFQETYEGEIWCLGAIHLRRRQSLGEGVSPMPMDADQLIANTGTPLIGRFFGTKKNRLNRKPFYWKSLYGIKLQIRDLINQKSPFFAIFHDF